MEVSLAFSNSIAGACIGAHCLPQAAIKRDTFWSGSLVPLPILATRPQSVPYLTVLFWPWCERGPVCAKTLAWSRLAWRLGSLLALMRARARPCRNVGRVAADVAPRSSGKLCYYGYFLGSVLSDCCHALSHRAVQSDGSHRRGQLSGLSG